MPLYKVSSTKKRLGHLSQSFSLPKSNIWKLMKIDDTIKKYLKGNYNNSSAIHKKVCTNNKNAN